MAQSITIWGATYSNTPAVLLPKTGGGSARFDDVSVTTAEAGDVVSGKKFISSNGTETNGSLVIQHYYTGSSAPSSSLGANGDIYLQIS